MLDESIRIQTSSILIPQTKRKDLKLDYVIQLVKTKAEKLY